MWRIFMFYRHITPKVEDALKDTPVVLINGARQIGKSTLVENLKYSQKINYHTLDNLNTLEAAKTDPLYFIQSNTTLMVIDEIQKAPELFPVIKEAVDKNRKPGQFLLTGSANVLLLPKVSESLSGRMEIINMWPLSLGEILNKKDLFVDRIFSKNLTFPSFTQIEKKELLSRILDGGYPEVLTRETEARKHAWFKSYITTLLQRDVRDLANIEGLTLLPRLLSLIATRSASLINYAELSRSSSISQTTLTRYLTLLQTVFLIYTLLPWSGNLSKRLVKAPKIYLNDTGLLSYLLGISQTRLQDEPHLTGFLLENFVATELKKQLTWNNTQAELFHYRTQSGQEIDLILENTQGQCVGIEVKSSSTVSQQDFKTLVAFADENKKVFLRGIVLYTGTQILPFGKDLHAIPISAIL